MKVNVALAFLGFFVLVAGLIWSRSLVAALLVIAGVGLMVAGGTRNDGATR